MLYGLIKSDSYYIVIHIVPMKPSTDNILPLYYKSFTFRIMTVEVRPLYYLPFSFLLQGYLRNLFAFLTLILQTA